MQNLYTAPTYQKAHSLLIIIKTKKEKRQNKKKNNIGSIKKKQKIAI